MLAIRSTLRVRWAPNSIQIGDVALGLYRSQLPAASTTAVRRTFRRAVFSVMYSERAGYTYANYVIDVLWPVSQDTLTEMLAEMGAKSGALVVILAINWMGPEPHHAEQWVPVLIDERGVVVGILARDALQVVPFAESESP